MSLKTIRNQQVVGSSPTAGSKRISNLQFEREWEHRPVSREVSHRASAVSSALPIALVILALVIFLNWQGYHWWTEYVDRLVTSLAGPWG